MHQANGEENDEGERLYAFLHEEFPDREFGNDSSDLRLEEDLGLYGDEAIDFLSRFAERFHVDMTGFRIDQRFRPEVDVISEFFRTLFSAKGKRGPSPSIHDLKRAVRTGRLE